MRIENVVKICCENIYRGILNNIKIKRQKHSNAASIRNNSKFKKNNYENNSKEVKEKTILDVEVIKVAEMISRNINNNNRFKIGSNQMIFSNLKINFSDIKLSSRNNINIKAQKYLKTDIQNQAYEKKITKIKKNNNDVNRNYIIIFIIISLLIKIFVQYILFNLYEFSRIIFYLLESKFNFENKIKYNNSFNKNKFYIFIAIHFFFFY